MTQASIIRKQITLFRSNVRDGIN